jgi:hypothetical protein
MRRSKKVAGLVACAFVALVAAMMGCSQQIVRPSFVVIEPVGNFNLPESTLAVLVHAVEERNATLYGLCFADTAAEQREFHATFDPADLAAYIGLGGHAPASWLRSSELAFFPGFVGYAPSAAYRCTFSLADDLGGIINFGGPTALRAYNLRYRVWSGPTAVAAGSARISFERVGLSGEYRVTRWDDARDTVGVRTWGMARLLGG